MKSLMIAGAACALMATAPLASAQSQSELAEIRAQLQALIQRVDNLEKENDALKQQNAQLQSATPSPKTAEKARAEAKVADWPNRVTLKGDVRYRHEQTDDELAAAERSRHLLRARASIEAKVNDSMQLGIGIATSDGGNPRGANVTLDGEFSRKGLDLDFAYFDWTFAPDMHAIGGKMKMPYFRPGQSLFFDNDVNPEGLALTAERGAFFGSTFGFWIDENVPIVGTTATAADTMMYGGQLGARLPIGDSHLVVAAMYYDLAAAKGRRPFFNGSPNGNSVLGSGTNATLRYDFRVVELSAEFTTKVGSLPLQVWTDVAQNQAAELDTAYTAGTLLGKASAPGSWEAGFAYQVIEKDAVFAQFIDSDFGGVADSSAWILRAGYAPMKNWSLNATYFMTDQNKDVGVQSDLSRLLLDFNAKF